MSSSSSMFRSSAVDDLIGSESGDCMSYHAVEELNAEPQEAQINKCGTYKSIVTRQYPPSIPLLAQTENSMGRTPWLFERELSSDGRLIVRAERMRHHAYLETHRENGRLIMTLVKVELSTVFRDEEEEGEELEELAAEGDGESGGFHPEEELAQEGSILWQESSLENESEPCGAANGNLGRASWASLRPMTTVG